MKRDFFFLIIEIICDRIIKISFAVQVMNVAASVDDGTQQEWGVDQWMASCNCKNDRNIELFKEVNIFLRARKAVSKQENAKHIFAIKNKHTVKSFIL